MDDLELGLDSDTVNKSQGNQSIRRNISLKLKQTSSNNSLHDGQKTSKREKAPPKVSSSRASKNESGESVGSHSNRSAVQTSSSLSSLNVNYAESILKNKLLKVDNKSNLIGEKVIDPLIHNCQICLLPILIYGRLMPCKHIFCFTCAKKTEKNCPRCNSNVDRIDQSALGTVFVCTVGGSKHGVSGCHRTYLSQRDLQSHIQCRHMNQRTSSHHHHQQQQHHHQQQMAVSQEQQMQQQQHTVLLGPNVMHPPPDFMGQLPPSSVHYVTPPPIYLARPPPQQQQIMMTGPPPAGHMINMQQQVMMIQQQQQQQTQQQHNTDLRMNVSSTQPQQQNIMVMAPRSTNLITVPIQDERSLHQFQAELHHQQQQQAAHFAHPAGAQFAANLMQQQQQQQQAQQQQNQQFLVGAPPQLLSHPPMVNQGHLRTQGAGGGRMVVPSQMNIHSFSRFEDPSHPTQFITATQGMTTNAWIQNQRPPMAGQGQNASGSNQQLQFY